MKKPFKFIHLLQLALFCCLALGFAGTSWYKFKEPAGQVSKPQTNAVSATITDLSSPALAAEWLVKGCTSPVSPDQKSFSGFPGFLKISDQLCGVAIAQNQLQLANCLVRFRKSDIIFPFHYFW